MDTHISDRGNGTIPPQQIGTTLSDLQNRILARPAPTADELARQDSERARHLSADAAVAHWKAVVDSAGQRYDSVRCSSFRCDHRKQSEVLAKVNAYAAGIMGHIEAGTPIVLYGPSGTGKDHLVLALAHAAIQQGVWPISYSTGYGLFQRLRDGMSDDTPEWRTLGEHIRAKVCILSDPIPAFGGLTQYQAGQLFAIVDARYRRRLCTWMTINVGSGGEAENRMGVALVDRLRHDGLALFCDWPSFRKPTATISAKGMDRA